MYLLIDNYDSFTYNLYQAFTGFGVELVVKRNDETTLKEIELFSPEKIIISPGPKTPKQAGISVKTIRKFSGKIPILGICLGHQCIAEAFGGKIARVKDIVHGKTSLIRHNGKDVFRNVPDPFPAARYHSLIVRKIPSVLEVTARSENGEVMGLKHREYPVTGLQFHPESFLTHKGKTIIKNFIDM